MPFTPTPEQLAIVEAATSTSENLLISALAGAAKTSTLVLMAEALVNQPILCLAFNKKIAVEMKERLPSWCQAQTLNSLGHRAWGAFTRKRITLEARKNYNIFNAWVRENLEDDEREEFWEDYQETFNAITSGKTVGWVPDATYNPSFHARLCPDDEFFDWLDFRPSENQRRCIIECSITNIKQGLDGLIDYDDQIFLSTVFRPCTFPYFHTIFVDEAQDLSALNHQMLFKLSKAGRARVIAVGDACQAIYGFRGAHEDSMQLLKERFKMHELTLSISFRCPRAVVRAAHWRAPHMQWPEWAIEGEVRHLKGWGSADIPDMAAIICRNNAPLFSLAMQLLRDGRYPEIVGTDFAKRILKIFEKLGQPSMPIDQVELAIGLYIERERQKKKDGDKLNDLHQSLLVFCEGAKDLADVMARIQRIFNSAGPIKLMTGHKSKGLEFHTVFFLDEHLIGERGQELNLRYVIQTRAQQTLIYVKSENYTPVVEVPKLTQVKGE